MDAPEQERRFFSPTPGWLAIFSLAVTGILFLSERFQWFPFNHHKGWTVLLAVAAVGGVMVLMLLWWLLALVFRWRFQFSIRTMLVMTVAVALPFSWLAVEIKRARKQHRTVETLAGRGRDIQYDCQAGNGGNSKVVAPVGRWLWELLQDDFFCNVVEANGFDLGYHSSYSSAGYDKAAEEDPNDVSKEDFQNLGSLSGLKRLSIYNCNVLNDTTMENLTSLTDLEYLQLVCEHVTDAGLENLERLSQLKELDIALCDQQLTDEGLRHLGRMTHLRKLTLWCGPAIHGFGLQYLKGLPDLEDFRLTIFDLPIAGKPGHDTPFKYLSELVQVRRLEVDCFHAAPDDIQRLRQALPNCRIKGPFD